jgi:predicted ATPase
VQFSARVFLTRVLWVLGMSDQATSMAEKSLKEAQATGHAMSQCYALALSACPISLWTGNFDTAAHYTTILLDLSRRHGLSHWATYGSLYQRVIDLRGSEAGLSRSPVTGSHEIAQSLPNFRSLSGLGELADALARAGRGAEGLAVLGQGIDQSEAGWIAPELLRLRGELVLSQGAPAAAETADSLFRQALDEARRQQALSWELRAATSLARLLNQQGQQADAIACLEPVYGRFTEGFDTADLIAAKRILDDTNRYGGRPERSN